MRSNQLIRDFLFLLFALYYGLNLLFHGGTIYSQLCIVTIILISGVYFLKTILLTERNSQFYNAWTLLLILNIIGFMLNPDFSEGRTRDMFKSILGCMLPFYPAYYFAKKEQLKATHLVWLLLILMPIFILQFFDVESNILATRDSDNTNVVNNIAYIFVGLIPFAFLIKKNKFLSGGVMIIIMLFIIQGAKRGALVAGTIGLLVYFYYMLITIEKRNRILGYIIVILIICCLSVFAYRNLISNEFLLGRMASISEGNTSGRDIIYGTIFSKWYNSENIFHLIFGFGFAASLEIAGGFAHSDWLELLSNLGIVGILTYLYLFYTALKCCLNKEWHIDKRVLMIAITSIWFFTTLISMWYTSFDGFTQAILLGYLMGSKSTSLE